MGNSILGFAIVVTHKPIKHLYLRIKPKTQNIIISAPIKVSSLVIEDFIKSKSVWIETKLQAIKTQPKPIVKKFVDGEQYYFKGEALTLTVNESLHTPCLTLSNSNLLLQISPKTSFAQKQQLLNNFYRKYLIVTVPSLISHYEKPMQVRVNSFGIKLMKTRWGSCNPNTKKIWLNLDLATKPARLLEYVLVHEMVHLLEGSHNQRFYQLMTKFMPDWSKFRGELNSLRIN